MIWRNHWEKNEYHWRTIYNIVLLMIFKTEWLVVASEKVAIADKTSENASSVISARRQGLKYGATYPYGYNPPKGPTEWPPTITDPVFASSDIVLVDKWKQEQSPETPPTLFFPRGSSTITVTIYPMPLMSKYYEIEGDPCRLYISMCLKAFDTGYMCARTLYDTYFTFNSYCSMEFANCQAKGPVWSFAFMGNCRVPNPPNIGERFHIEGDNFLEGAILNSPPFDPLQDDQVTY